METHLFICIFFFYEQTENYKLNNAEFYIHFCLLVIIFHFPQQSNHLHVLPEMQLGGK